MKTLMVAMLAVVSVGCAHNKGAGSTPEGTPNPQVLSKLKTIAPKSTESGVVVLYRNTVFGSMFGPISFNGTLWIDDQAAGEVTDDKYNVIELPAGRHSFRVLGTPQGFPLQTTTVVNVVGGETKYLELRTIQEFNNATIRFQPGATPEVVAVDCTLGFELDLAAEAQKKPTTTSSRM
ncbi:MAG: hypothetical protein JNK82_45370 [Myxococcaceae bacterium]|nr:hypothetical protein [Myxococcaceae bacterium]